MYLVYGIGLYGGVDYVPGFFHVATEFYHVYYVPIMPVGSHIILKEDGKRFSGVSIPLQSKSILKAYGVGGVPAVWVILGIWAMIAQTLKPDLGSPLTPLAMGGAVFAIWLLILLVATKSKKANYERACRLGVIAGLNEKGWRLLNQHFGRSGAQPQTTS